MATEPFASWMKYYSMKDRVAHLPEEPQLIIYLKANTCYMHIWSGLAILSKIIFKFFNKKWAQPLSIKNWRHAWNTQMNEKKRKWKQFPGKKYLL